MISKEEFFEKLKTVKDAVSVSGKHYTSISFNGKKISGIRVEAQGSFSIDADCLYEAYVAAQKSGVTINTTFLKDFITNRAQSPSLAILAKMGV